MNEDEKKVSGADDGLAELLNTFGGYSEDISEDDAALTDDTVEAAFPIDDIDDGVSTEDDTAISAADIVSEDSATVSDGGTIDFGGIIFEEGSVEITPNDTDVTTAESIDDVAGNAVTEGADEFSEDPAPAIEDTSADEYTYAEPEAIAAVSHKKNKKKRKNKNKNKAAFAETVENVECDSTEPVAAENVADDAEPVPEAPGEELPTIEAVAPVEEDAAAEELVPVAKPERKKKIKNKNKKNPPVVEEEPEEEEKPATPTRLVIVLAAICAAVALLLGAVNFFTASIIASNAEVAMLTSIQAIFDENVTVEAVTVPEEGDLSGLYLVMKNGGVCGYSAAVAPSGFGGPINMMIGVDSSGKIVGVRIVSMSETPGLGSKVGGDSFLEQFKGAADVLSFGNGADAISGATISSTAVLKGVNSVLSSEIDLAALAAERGLEVVPFVYGEADTGAVTITTEVVTDTDVTTVVTESAPATDAVSDTETETEEGLPTPPEVEKGDTPPDIIVDNPNNETPDFDVDYDEGDTEYETITTEPESDVTEETEAETEEVTTTTVTTTVTTTTETTTVETTTEETTVTTVTTTLPETEPPAEETTVEETEPETVATETEAPVDTTEE